MNGRQPPVPSIANLPHRAWLRTLSGATLLAVGIQGTAADAVNLAALPLSVPGETDPTGQNNALEADVPAIATPVVSPIVQPQFSPFTRLGQQVQALVQSSPVAPVDAPVDQLENHRRLLHSRANQVEAELLGLQHLLSIQAYGTSFADRLLDEDSLYQTKLQELRSLEAQLHTAIKQNDPAGQTRLKKQVERLDQNLQRRAQLKLQQHIQRATATSTLGLWQEPMYRESLRWLMEHTHERHFLNARQQILANTLVAIANN